MCTLFCVLYNVHESISTTVYSICIFNVRVAVTVYLFRNDSGLAPGRELSVINQLNLGFKHLFHVYGYTYWYSVLTSVVDLDNFEAEQYSRTIYDKDPDKNKVHGLQKIICAIINRIWIRESLKLRNWMRQNSSNPAGSGSATLIRVGNSLIGFSSV